MQRPRSPDLVEDGSETRVPLGEETLAVSRVARQVGRVRVEIVPETHDETVDVDVAEILTEIERRPVGRIVRRAPRPRWEGDVLVVPVVEEILVVEKRLRVVEEVRLSRVRKSRRVKKTVTLRRTRAVVERLKPDVSPASEER